MRHDPRRKSLNATLFRILAGAGLLAGAGVLPACSSKPDIILDIPNESANIAEAMRLKQRGDGLMGDGKHLEAIEQYKAAIKKHNMYGEAWSNLGIALLKDNNRYDAQQAYIRAAELMPLDPTPMDNLGVLYMETNLPEDALRYFEMALERRPQYLPSLRGAVRAAQLLGQSEEADLARIKMGLRLEADPKWRTMFERQLARVKADLADEERNSPGFSKPRPANGGNGDRRSDGESGRVEAGVVAPRVDE